MRVILIFMFSMSLFSDTYFITQKEYGALLYNHPRGIGCEKCHGENGKGMVIATYYTKGKLKRLKGGNITNLNFKNFYNALNSQIFAMPRYYLTDSEIQTLYQYLHQKSPDHAK